MILGLDLRGRSHEAALEIAWRTAPPSSQPIEAMLDHEAVKPLRSLLVERPDWRASFEQRSDMVLLRLSLRDQPL